ncbi:hypothetical protein [Thiolapillus sp.]
MTEEPLLPPEQAKSLLLDYYHCTFFLPLIGLPYGLRPSGGEAHCYNEKTDAPDDSQAWLYFSATQRSNLFPRHCHDDGQEPHPRPLEEWRLPEKTARGLAWHLGKDEERHDPLKYQKAVFKSVRLYRYFNGIYLLAFTVLPQRLARLREQQQALLRAKLEELAVKFHEDNRRKPGGKEQEQLKSQAEQWLREEGVPLFRPSCPAFAHQALETCGGQAEGYRELQLEAWLRFTRLARQIYPSFAEQNQEGKLSPLSLYGADDQLLARDFDRKLAPEIPAKDGEQFSNSLAYLLGLFFPKESDNLEKILREKLHLDDDRMFVSVAYSLVEKKLPPGELERLFSLVLYVDRLADTWTDLDGWVYTPEVIRERMDGQMFRLWQGLGGHYGYTSYSAAYFYPDAFFRNVIAPRHVLPIYDRMQIQALFYAASLKKYDLGICEQTGRMLQAIDWQSLRRLREDFIRFTNQYWFHDLTEQMQGKEIFRLQQKALGMEEHYAIIKDKLERTDEYLQGEHERRMNEWSSHISFWGVIVAVMAIYFTALPLFVSQDSNMTIKLIGVVFGAGIAALLGRWKKFRR